jgi:hypothetical protein
MRYPVAIEPGHDTAAFGVVSPDLPGCFSAGDTLDEPWPGRRRPRRPGLMPRWMPTKPYRRLRV